jgi:hypothetical protein
LCRDRLVDWRLLRYSYFIVGIAEALTCILSYFTGASCVISWLRIMLMCHAVFNYFGIPGSVVLFSDPYWMSSSPDLVVNGKTFTASQQVAIVYEAHAAYYFTIVACQAWYAQSEAARLCWHYTGALALLLQARLHMQDAPGFAARARRDAKYIHDHRGVCGDLRGDVLHLRRRGAKLLPDGVPGRLLVRHWHAPNCPTIEGHRCRFLPNFAFGIFIYFYTEYSKKLTRENPDGWWARHMQW